MYSNSGNPLTKPSQFLTPGANTQQQKPLPNTPLNHNRSAYANSGGSSRLPNQQYNVQQQQQRYPNTPFPIINHNQKGFVEKMVDYLIGDGLNNRYGMVCKECFSHNGKTPTFNS